MADSSLTQVIQRVAAETMKAMKPSDYIVGLVTSVDPLEVKISNELTIDSEFIDVCEQLTDHKVKVTIKGKTESVSDHTHPISDSSTGAAGEHDHDIKLDEKTITIHNALKVNDRVAMLRRGRGQKFLIIDRVVSDDDS